MVGEAAATNEGLRRVLELIREEVAAHTVTLLSYDRAHKEVTVATSVGAGTDLVEQELSGPGADLDALEEASSTDGEWGLGITEAHDTLRAQGIRSLARVQLSAHGGQVDFMVLGLPDPHDRVRDRLAAQLDVVVPWIEGAVGCARLGETVSMLHTQRDLRNQMVSLVAHDLRGSLSAAKLAAQLLTHDSDASDARRQLAEKIDMNIDRTERMLRDLLEANRVHSGRRVSIRRQRCDLSAVARRVAGGFRTAHGERSVHVDVPEETWGEWDADQLHRVISNLATVAIKQGPSATPIQIEVTADERCARVLVHPIVLRTREGATPRAELSLALAHGCAEAHGGTVELQHERAGDAVAVVLPLHPPADSTASGARDESLGR